MVAQAVVTDQTMKELTRAIQQMQGKGKESPADMMSKAIKEAASEFATTAVGRATTPLLKAMDAINKLVALIVMPFTNLILPVLIPMLYLLSPIVRFLSIQLRPAFMALMDQAKQMKSTIQGSGSPLVALAEGMAGMVGIFVEKALPAFFTIGATLVDAIVKTLAAVIPEMGKLWDRFGPWLGELWGKFQPWISSLWAGMKGWVDENWPKFQGWIAEQWLKFQPWIAEQWNGMSTWISEQWQKFQPWIAEQWGKMVSWVSEGFSDIVNWVAINLATPLLNGVAGLLDGIPPVLDSIYTKLVGFVDDINVAIRSMIADIMTAINGSWFLRTVGIVTGMSTGDMATNAQTALVNAMTTRDKNISSPRSLGIASPGDSVRAAAASVERDAAMRELIREMKTMNEKGIYGPPAPIEITIHNSDGSMTTHRYNAGSVTQSGIVGT